MSVKLFFWNIRGLNDPDKHRTFVNWLLFHKPLFGTLLESHVKEVSLLPLMTKLCRSWNFYLNHQSDKDGRIILIWKHPLKVQVLSADRSDLWAELMYLHDTFDLQNNRWVVGGDFNQIIVPSEHSSHFVAAQDSQMYQFQDCLLHNGLFDLRYNGHFITNCAGKCASVTNSATVPGGKSLERSLDLPISIAFVKSERYNAVRSFTTAMGTLITDPIEMSHLAVSHFQSVLGPWSNTSPPINSLPSWFAQLTNFRVPQHKSRHRQGFWYSLLGFHPLLSSGTSTPIKVHLLDQSLHLHNPSFFRRWSTNFHRWIFEVSPKCASGSQGVWRSGLAVSLQKTSFYASGLSEQEINTIQASTGMVNGTLSFKYLGVPLNSKKLSLANCEPLLHQVKNHLSSWAVKTLSFAGRLLLIKTIIAGITTFWCWAFILPKAF